MRKRVIWILDNIPETINAVDTRYCCCSPVKFTPPGPLRIMGGVITPANMASAC